MPGAEVPFSSAYAAPMPPAPQPGAAHAAPRDYPLFHHAGGHAGGYHGGGLPGGNPALNPSLAGLPNGGAGGPYYGGGPAGGLHFGGGLQFGSLAADEAPAAGDPVVPNPNPSAGAGGEAGARGGGPAGAGMNADPSVNAPPPQHAGHARAPAHGSIAPPAQAPPTSTASLAQVCVVGFQGFSRSLLNLTLCPAAGTAAPDLLARQILISRQPRLAA